MGQALVSNFSLKKVTIPTDVDGLMDAGVDIRGLVLLGAVMPSAWTTAAITFKGSVDGGTVYNDLYDEDGTEISWTGAAASRLLLAAGAAPLIGGITHLMLRSGTTSLAVAQSASRELWLIVGVPNP